MLFDKKQQLAICLLGVMLAADFIFCGYIPLKRKLNDVRSGVQTLQSVINQAEIKKSQLPIFKERLSQLKAQTINFEAAVPKNKDIGLFVQKIGDLMSDYNLNNQMIQPGEQAALKDLNCIAVTMNCQGSLRDIFGFFKKLQKMDRIIRIEEVKLLADGNFSGQIKMESKAIIYYQGE